MLVTVGEYRLWLETAGSGDPTVVLDAGLNAGADSWNRVAPAVATFARVCRYDRVGMGRSDPAPRPYVTRELAADLRALLTNAGIDGPYLLVGHSHGGLTARVFAGRYPELVAGLVLVDAPHPDYPARWLERFPPTGPDEHPVMTESRAAFRRMVNEVDHTPLAAGEVDYPRSLADVRGAGPFADLPLIVVSAGRPGSYPAGFATDLADRVDAFVREMQRDLTHLSTRSVHLIAERSGHLIPQDQPEVVVDAIRHVVEEVRGRSPKRAT